MNFLSIEEIKSLSVDSAVQYAQEIRRHLIDTVMVSGGHLASNLGVVEISMACIRLFDLPCDKIIYDVGHQSYVHKLLTGRFFDSSTLRTFGNFSGFTKREESVYDPFGAGHSSTALSAAVGFSKAARIKGESSFSVAVVGDGAFCTGMSFEALNNIDKKDRLIIILNDNEMSISKNVGTMSGYLLKIRSTKKYLRLKRQTKKAFGKIPLVGTTLSRFAGNVKYYVKHIVVKNTFFEELGIRYLGPADGNHLETVELLLKEAKSYSQPVLIHLCTKKGKGYAEAENDPDRFHAVGANSLEHKDKKITYSEFFGDYINSVAEKDKDVVAITAAMSDGTGLNKFRKNYPDRFFDVGICEEHAVTFASALNASGLSPYFAVYSTFFQRCYDQLLHDCSLQKLKVTLALDRAGFCPQDGPTHHGVFDVPLLLTVPDMTVFSPVSFEEMKYSFDIASTLPSSVAVRYPKGCENLAIKEAFPTLSDFTIDENKCDVVIATYGRVTSEALIAKEKLAQKGIAAGVLKFLKLKPIDFDAVSQLIRQTGAALVVFLEEGIKTGGFGEHLFSNISIPQNREIIAIDETFIPHGTLRELYDYAGLSADRVHDRIVSWMNQKK